MLIDPVTVVAQLINFTILLVALKLLLFDRVVRHMDRQKQAMVAREEESRERMRSADARARELDRRLQELEHTREGLAFEAREDARRQRERLIELARDDVAEQRRRWWVAMEREQERIAHRIRSRLGEEVIELAAQILGDLADADLEDRFLDAFARRLDALSPAERGQWQDWIAADRHAVVVTDRTLPQEQRSTIDCLISNLAGEAVEIDFACDPALIGGIELQAGGHALGWTVRGYLERIDESLRSALSARDDHREAETHAGA